MKSQLVRWPVMFTWLRCRLNVKFKPVVLSRAHGFRNNYMLHSVYFRSLVDLENKSCVRVPLVIILPECRELNPCCCDGLWAVSLEQLSQGIWRALFKMRKYSNPTDTLTIYIYVYIQNNRGAVQSVAKGQKRYCTRVAQTKAHFFSFLEVNIRLRTELDNICFFQVLMQLY